MSDKHHDSHEAERHQHSTASHEHAAHGTGSHETISADPAADHTTFQGEPNGLPPAAPEVQLEAPAEVKALREWFHFNVKNSIHSQDTAHYNDVFRMTEALAAKLHAKHPVEKET